MGVCWLWTLSKVGVWGGLKVNEKQIERAEYVGGYETCLYPHGGSEGIIDLFLCKVFLGYHSVDLR